MYKNQFISIYTRKATSIIMILNIIMYLCICVTPIPVFSIILYYLSMTNWKKTANG